MGIPQLTNSQYMDGLTLVRFDLLQYTRWILFPAQAKSNHRWVSQFSVDFLPLLFRVQSFVFSIVDTRFTQWSSQLPCQLRWLITIWSNFIRKGGMIQLASTAGLMNLIAIIITFPWSEAATKRGCRSRRGLAWHYCQHCLAGTSGEIWRLSF